MSRLGLFLALCVFLFGVVCGETIVHDNFGNVVNLPLTGGNATGGYTIQGSLINTSPFVLTVSIFDSTHLNPGQSQTEIESFFIQNGFFNATLTSQTFATCTLGFDTQTPPNPIFTSCNPPSPSGNFLGSAASPNTNAGQYVFTFSIPVLGTLTLNMTYTLTQGPAEVDRIFIRVDNPKLPTIVGDPQFVGLRGQSYQVHGIDGAVYNIISEKETQVNSRFVFLSEGSCPIFNGVPDTNCWSHPGSYLGEIGIQQVVDGKTHAALITSGGAKEGFSAVQLDGHKLKVGETKTYGTFSITYSTTHSITVTTAHFDFEFSNSDMFINQALRAKLPLSKLTSHGLLGQTHSAKVYPTATRYIEGSVDDYVIADNDIFGTDFIHNQFNQ